MSVIANKQKSRMRWYTVFMLFIVTTVNYADRATFSIAGTALATDLKLDPVMMGYIFSAFGWSYVLGQLPGGVLLDRFGPKTIYAISIFARSIFTFFQGFIGSFQVLAAVALLFSLRFFIGLAEAPAFPGNSRIVAAWFPTSERGTATAIFSSAQYFATVLFAPLMGWITYLYGWKYAFILMGILGITLAFIWIKVIYGPHEHPRINLEELEYIKEGGALLNMGQGANGVPCHVLQFRYLKELLQNRMLMGVYIGQYCIVTINYFFLTWFPVYLVQERGMSIIKVGFVAVLPALFGFAGGVLGGMFSDYLLKHGKSLTFARKTPIVMGMLISISLILSNYVETGWIVIALMSFAFFGKGFGTLGWVVMSDTSPKEIMGLSGAIFNMFGNLAAITTPIVIGYILKSTGTFNGALVFVGINAMVAILSYLFVVGEIKRIELKPREMAV